MHPFETLFVKSSWHVGEPFATAYSRWAARLASSSSSSSSTSSSSSSSPSSSSAFDAGTKGTFDEPRYRYAISPEAQLDSRVRSCYSGEAGNKKEAGSTPPPPPLPEWRRAEADDDGGWRNWWRD